MSTKSASLVIASALLSSAISSGHAHFADAENHGVPEDAGAWGWNKSEFVVGTVEKEEWRAKGYRVSWLDGDDVYLDPEAAFAAAQRLAQAQGTSLSISAQTLWKRMYEQGKLASRDDTRIRNVVRKVIAGNRRNIIHISASTLSPRSGPNGPNGPRPKVSAALGAEKMGRFSEAPEKTAHETGPQTVASARCGPNGPFGPQMEHKGAAEKNNLTEPPNRDDAGNEGEWSA